MASVLGTLGNDILTPTFGPDAFDGLGGIDLVDYSAAELNPTPSNPQVTGVSVSLDSGGTSGTLANGDTFANVEGFIGSAYNDLLDGNNDDNQLYGGAGDDLLFGNGGSDYLDGGAGVDGAFYLFATQGATVNLADPSQNAGDALGDVLVSIENLHGSNYDDNFAGDAGANWLDGRGGNDILNGRAGNDYLYGDDGQDSLDGGDGVDSLNGGAGDDLLTGGSGYDTAYFSGLSSAFHWIRNGDGSWTVTDTRGTEGTDLLTGIEALSFDDGAFGLPNSPEADDIFRFYNTNTKTHFYTNSESERDFVIGHYKSFRYEGNVFDTTATADTGVGVYRFYNTKTKTHFYTSNASERDYIQDNYKNYKYEGVAYYAYSDDANGAHIPLYRFYNTKTNTHFFTADANEQQYVAEHYSSFRYEGIAFYVDLA